MTVIWVSALVTPMPMSALGIAKLAGRRPSEPPTPCSDPHALQGAQDLFESVLILETLLALAPGGVASFWLIATALVASVLTHALYWILIALVNKVWLRNEAVTDSAQRFFTAAGSPNECGWTMLRDRWERSQLYRAVTSVALIPLAVAFAMQAGDSRTFAPSCASHFPDSVA
jgi:hypothetical protein